MKMPDDFAAESDLQRQLAVAELRIRAIEYLQQTASEWPFEVECADDAEPSDVFKRAARVAVALDDRRECAVHNLKQIRFRPYDCKYEGAWRVEVGFRPHGPWSGKEWYVSSEQLFAAWEKAKP